MAGLALLARNLFKRSREASDNEATQRIQEILEKGSLGTVPEAPAEKTEAVKRSPTIDRLAEKLSASTMFQEREGRDFMAHLEMQLIQAGLRSRYTPEQALSLALIIWTFGVVAPVLLMLFLPLPKLVFILTIGFFAAYPGLKLRALVKTRQDAIAAEVPFFIMQLRMSLSTGMATIDNAILRVARTAEEDPYDSILSREFAQAQIEYSMGGKSMEQALRDIGRRTGVISVISLCEALIQGIRTGAPLADALEEYSVQAREMWRQDMRNYKNRKEPMVTIGLVITLFGAFIIFATPLALGLMHALQGL